MAAMENHMHTYAARVQSEDLAGTQIVVFVDALEIFAVLEELEREKLRSAPYVDVRLNGCEPAWKVHIQGALKTKLAPFVVTHNTESFLNLSIFLDLCSVQVDARLRESRNEE